MFNLISVICNEMWGYFKPANRVNNAIRKKKKLAKRKCMITVVLFPFGHAKAAHENIATDMVGKSVHTLIVSPCQQSSSSKDVQTRFTNNNTRIHPINSFFFQKFKWHEREREREKMLCNFILK